MAKLTTNIPMGDCVTQASIMRNVRDPLELHLNRKYLKSGQKWLRLASATHMGSRRDPDPKLIFSIRFTKPLYW